MQAAVIQLEESGKKKDRDSAIKQLRDFHAWLRGLQFLDPACGSGNFLYVTMAAVKRIELEVISATERVGGKEQKEAILDEVHPRQFHGIEIKPWAREIAELTLWIGYHQFWREAHGGRTPPDPILEDTGTIECRDAVLAYDSIVHRPEKDRPDPTPRIISPVTGELIPDPTAKLKYMEYVNPRPAEWPKADFIVGNPPYIGTSRQRDALGDGYVDSVRAAYPEIPDTADFVMYWWARAAAAVGSGITLRAGLITTNSITQAQNRAVVRHAMETGVRVIWAIANHPWRDDVNDADVRVAMTVTGRDVTIAARLIDVNELGQVEAIKSSHIIEEDLTTSGVARAANTPLDANEGMAHRGFQLIGSGFLLTGIEAESVIAADSRSGEVIRPYLHGRDFAGRPRGLRVIDFALSTIEEARTYPVAFQRVIDRVKPERDANAREAYRRNWWRFGEPRPELRAAVLHLRRFIVTAETMRHRLFGFLDVRNAPDNKLVCIATDNATHLGYLSSAHHGAWAVAAGSRLGVGDDPVYAKRLAFDPFPFPDPSPDLRIRIGVLAERLDAHRKDAIARDERVTMTGMYNVVEKLRSGEALTSKERVVHEIAACGVLRDLHDELDGLVAEAYGWPWPMQKEEILERLVKLHDERVEEEKRGQIRWLRPDYQIPRFAPAGTPATLGIPDAPAAAAEPVALRPWPATAVEQLAAIGALVGQEPRLADDIGAAFAGAKRELVARHLETLALMGEIAMDGEGRYSVVRKAA